MKEHPGIEDMRLMQVDGFVHAKKHRGVRVLFSIPIVLRPLRHLLMPEDG